MRLLETIEIAKPCPASWADMRGDAQVRFCGQCEMNVYNLSEMSEAEAEALILEREGVERTCVRLYRRKDGTVITRDCPVGLAAFKRKVRAVWAGAAALLFSLLGLFGWGVANSSSGEGVFVDCYDEIQGAMIVMPPPPPPPAKQ